MDFGNAIDPLIQSSVQDTSILSFFNPRTAALVGASPKPGPSRALLANMLRGLNGCNTVYPVNGKYKELLNQKCYPNLESCPTVPDLVAIITPAKIVPNVVKQCVDLGVPAVVIVSGGFAFGLQSIFTSLYAGFKETGPEGKKLEDLIMEEVVRSNHKTRVLGPNCVGQMCPLSGWNTTFCTQMCLPGNIAYISQSGAMITSVLDWTIQNNIGFAYMSSVGSMVDVDWAELFDHFGQDPKVKSILCYMETIGEPRNFLMAAREVSLHKPIIVLKSGRSKGAAKAAISHTGSLAGSDDVLDQAFKRAGIVRVDTISELFGLAEILSKQPVPRGPRLTIVTHAGGPGVLATDALEMNGGELATLTDETMTKLNATLPPEWSHGNPIDMIGTATAATYASTLDIVEKDDGTDGILVIMVPVAVASPVAVAQAIILFGNQTDKPVFACMMGGEEMAPARAMLGRSKIPCFTFADQATKMFNYMWFYRKNLSLMYEPVHEIALDDLSAKVAKASVASYLQKAIKEGKTILSESESKELLKLYGIPVAETIVCRTFKEAISAAERIGYPVVVKIHSNTITHKSDVGGVLLNITDSSGVKNAFATIESNVKSKFPATFSIDFLGVTVQPYLSPIDSTELLIGSNSDEQFGPIVVVGAGGVMVDIMKDSAIGIPPLNEKLALHQLSETKIYKALLEFRGRAPIDMDKLLGVIINFSRLVTEHRHLREVDINPFYVSSTQMMAVDARIVLHDQSTDLTLLPPVAIRPYPTQYIKRITLANGTEAIIRPTRPEDENLIIDFHTSLSDDVVLAYFRQNLSLERRTAHSRLVRILYGDYSRLLNLGVFDKKSKSLLAVARMAFNRDRTANYFCLVKPQSQGMGLGYVLTSNVIEIAKAEGVEMIVLRAQKNLPYAEASRKMGYKCGFKLVNGPNDPDYIMLYNPNESNNPVRGAKRKAFVSPVASPEPGSSPSILKLVLQ